MEDKEYKGLYDFLENAPEPTETDGGNMEVFKKFFKRIWMDKVPESRIKNNGIIEVNEWKDEDDGYFKFGATIGGSMYTGLGGLKLYLFDWDGGYEKIVYNGVELNEEQEKEFLQNLREDEEE